MTMMPILHALRCVLSGVLCSTLAISAALAQEADEKTVSNRFRLTLSDPDKLLGDRAALFRENALAASEIWSGYFRGDGEVNLRIEVLPGDGGASARCPAPQFVKNVGANKLYEMSAATKLRKGKAANNDTVDIAMTVHIGYLKDLWLDPQPRTRSTPMPVNGLDAVSLFLHEIAHGLGMNGWLDAKTGDLDKSHFSTYDRCVLVEKGEFYFVGLNALRVYGKPVPLSRKNNNYHHLDRKGAPPNDVLDASLMNGEYFERGRRFSPTPLDLAILQDCGLPMVIPAETRD